MKLASVIGVVAVLGLLDTKTAGATQSNVFGDVDCDGSVNAVDALKILRQNAGLPLTQTQPCPSIGSTPTASPTQVPSNTPAPTSTPTPTPAPSSSPSPIPTSPPGSRGHRGHNG